MNVPVGRRTDRRWFVFGDGRTVNAEKGRQPGLNRLDRVGNGRHPGFAVSGSPEKAAFAPVVPAILAVQSERCGGQSFHREQGWERLCRGGP